MSIWDSPEMQVNEEFVKFEKVGDTITGQILSIKAHKFDNGKVAPQILLELDDGTEKTVTAGQVRLKAALAEQRPEAGDRLTVTLTQIEPRSGGKELKHFQVTIDRGDSTAKIPASTIPPTGPTTAAAAPQPDAQALLAAMANLTDEQKKALGLA